MHVEMSAEYNCGNCFNATGTASSMQHGITPEVGAFATCTSSYLKAVPAALPGNGSAAPAARAAEPWRLRDLRTFKPRSWLEGRREGDPLEVAANWANGMLSSGDISICLMGVPPC